MTGASILALALSLSAWYWVHSRQGVSPQKGGGTTGASSVTGTMAGVPQSGQNPSSEQTDRGSERSAVAGDAAQSNDAVPPSRVAKLTAELKRIDENARNLESGEDQDGEKDSNHAGAFKADPGRIAARLFYVRAARALESFVSESSGIELESELLRTQLQRTFSDSALSHRVRGALFALGGAIDPDPVRFLGRLSPGSEEERSGMIGVVWRQGRQGPGDRIGVELNPAEFYEENAKDRQGSALPLPLHRPPRPEVEIYLRSLVLSPLQPQPVSNSEVRRRLMALLMLGTGIDAHPETLQTFVDLLHDRSYRYLRGSVLYILSRAKGAEARAALHDYLEDPDIAGDERAGFEKDLARYSMVKHGGLGAGKVDSLAAALLDPRVRDATDRAAVHRRTMAIGTLMTALPGLTPPDRVRALKILADRAANDVDAGTRAFSIVVFGSDQSGGVQRLETLRRALRGDVDPDVRLAAAVALAKTRGPLASEARATLESNLGLEEDEATRKKIAAILARKAE